MSPSASGKVKGTRARRSRRGCRNCKLRKIKCDEARPRCRGCQAYGVLCNFDRSVPDLQLLVEAQPEVNYERMLDNTSLAARRGLHDFNPNPRMNNIFSTVATSSTPLLDTKDNMLLLSIQDCMGPVWGSAIDGSLQLALEFSFLMHAMLAVATAYRRYLTSPPQAPSYRTLAELTHFSQSTVLFSKKLSRPTCAQDKDALWATAALYGVLLFLTIDRSGFEKSWPFQDSKTGTLDWLAMIDAKWALWELTNPLRPDSIFCCLTDVYAELRINVPLSGVLNVCPSLARVCDLNENSTAATNPYFEPVHAISQLDNQTDRRIYLARVLAFISCMSQRYKDLLIRRDARSLLLLALWYNKAGGAIWWIELRARIECPAICAYLRRYHGHDTLLLDLLPLPREFMPICGVASSYTEIERP